VCRLEWCLGEELGEELLDLILAERQQRKRLPPVHVRDESRL
jgi:hypothetical protein